MPYSGGQIPKTGDTVKHRSGNVGTVFELDPRTNETADQERIKVTFDDGKTTVDLASEFRLLKRVSE